jgi:methyl-accepting chemotaxis protein
MQAKLAAGFLTVALGYLVAGLAIPKLGLGPGPELLLTASTYVAIGLGAAWLISFVLGRRLRQLAKVAAQISKGDLTRRIDTLGNDETAELARSLSVMTESLLNVVLEVQATAERINDSARSLSVVSDGINATTEDIARAAREIAKGADDQSSQVLRTTETTRQLAQVVEQVADRAKEVHESARTAAERAARGAEDAEQAARGIGQLTKRTSSAKTAVEGFRLKAEEIGNIVSSITSISQQTHLLAINAAIEAARAGPEGRGFGVVAEEVGRLADNVRRFAEQISSISSEILQGTQGVADEIRRSVSAAEELRIVVERGASSFKGILAATRGTAARIAEISKLTSRQKADAASVCQALEEISTVVGRNVLGTEDASSATQEQTLSMQKMVESARALARTSDQLEELVAIFRVH